MKPESIEAIDAAMKSLRDIERDFRQRISEVLAVIEGVFNAESKSESSQDSTER